jgi:lipoprotein NlpI
LAGAAAHAQDSDVDRCSALTGKPDLAIQHCTRAIDSGRLSGDTLAKMHYNRGIEWAAKGDYDRAIADYDAALRASPKFADAYYNRGNAWGLKGDPDRAITDYDAFLRLNPKDPAAHIARAVELMVKGDYARAVAGYDTALALDPRSGIALHGRGRANFYGGDPRRAVADLERAWRTDLNLYTAAWLYLARKRAGAIDAEELLDSETRGHRDGNWPTAVLMLYMGRTDVDSVMASAMDRDPKRQSEQTCEASFYVAQWHLLRKENDRALALLKQAQSGCPRDFLEHEGAVVEMRRLGGKP